MKIVFVGALGRFPIGGHAWVDLQYLLGLEHLGHDVFYLEDCGPESWVYSWEDEELTTSADYPTSYIRSTLQGYGVGWAYRVGDEVTGATLSEVRETLADTDLLLIRGGPIPTWRPEYDLPRRRAYIDVDPGFTQIGAVHGSRGALVETLDRCEHLFTIGKNIGREDCLIPTLDRQWHVTVSPVFLPAWPVVNASQASPITSILQWRSYREVEHNGQRYGNKDRTFPPFLDLPRVTGENFRIALTGGDANLFRDHAWEVVLGWEATRTAGRYQRFIQSSRAEFTVAKHGYVAMNTGWISDRSVCYLASGKPVVTMDTGFSTWLPEGQGIMAFDDFEGAVAGIDSLGSDGESQRKAARRTAEIFFATDEVLPDLLDQALG